MHDLIAATTLPLYRTATPGWLTATIAIAAILLALLAIAFMFWRVDSPDSTVTTDATDGAGPSDNAPRRYPTVYNDPVLVISALGVIALAIAAWLLR